MAKLREGKDVSHVLPQSGVESGAALEDAEVRRPSCAWLTQVTRAKGPGKQCTPAPQAEAGMSSSPPSTSEVSAQPFSNPPVPLSPPPPGFRSGPEAWDGLPEAALASCLPGPVTFPRSSRRDLRVPTKRLPTKRLPSPGQRVPCPQMTVSFSDLEPGPTFPSQAWECPMGFSPADRGGVRRRREGGEPLVGRWKSLNWSFLLSPPSGPCPAALSSYVFLFSQHTTLSVPLLFFRMSFPHSPAWQAPTLSLRPARRSPPRQHRSFLGTKHASRGPSCRFLPELPAPVAPADFSASFLRLLEARTTPDFSVWGAPLTVAHPPNIYCTDELS